MSMPFYVSPEQLMKDRADYARKGIARGRSVVVLAYDDGIAFATENPSRALHKISEIYDRIAFAAVGKYNEFENLRVAGVRYADLRGYSYDRADVNARGLANAYAQTLGTVFTTESKPLEVELCVAEVGATPADDQIYRLSYDGSVADEHGHVVMGGQAEHLSERLAAEWRPGMDLAGVVQLAVRVLSSQPGSDDARTLEPAQLEVAVLDRTRPRRTFRRLPAPMLADLLQRGTTQGSGAAQGDGPAQGDGSAQGDAAARPNGAAQGDGPTRTSGAADAPDEADAPSNLASTDGPDSAAGPDSERG